MNQIKVCLFFLLDPEILIFNWYKENGEIFYDVFHDITNIMYKKSILEFSDPDEFASLQEHLYIHWIGNIEMNMKKTEKDNEMKKWFEKYGSLYNNLQLSDLTTVGVSNRGNSSNSVDCSIDMKEINSNEITIHSNSKYEPFISIKQKSKFFTFSEINFLEKLKLRSRIIYNKLKKNLLIKINKKPMSLESININNKNFHISKRSIRKKKERERYLLKRETNNCLLFTLKSLSDKISIRSNIKAFKDKDFETQLFLASKLLKEKSRKLLVYKGVMYNTIEEFLNKTSKLAIIVFKVKEFTFHTEAIKNKQFLIKPEKLVLDMVKEKRYISYYEIEDI